jgi:hypothetical protein
MDENDLSFILITFSHRLKGQDAGPAVRAETPDRM